MNPIELAEMVEKWGNQLESKDIKEIAKTLRTLHEENLFLKNKAKEIFEYFMDKE
jgi:hypothetical protein